MNKIAANEKLVLDESQPSRNLVRYLFLQHVQFSCSFHYALHYTYSVESVVENSAELPRSGKNIWKMKFFPGQGKVREICGWPGKFRKDLESQGKVRDFENKWLWFSENLFILFKREKDVHSHEII